MLAFSGDVACNAIARFSENDLIQPTADSNGRHARHYHLLALYIFVAPSTGGKNIPLPPANDDARRRLSSHGKSTSHPLEQHTSSNCYHGCGETSGTL